MSIAPSNRYKLYQPVSLTSVFIVTFPMYDTDDLRVSVDGADVLDFVVNATFVDGVSNDATITLASEVAGVDVEIYGNRSPRRDNNYRANSPNLALNLQRDMDALTAVQQEQLRDFAAAFTLNGEVEAVRSLNKTALQRAYRALVFSQDGLGLEVGPELGQLEQLVEQAQAAADITTFGRYSTVSLMAAETDILVAGTVVHAAAVPYKVAAVDATDADVSGPVNKFYDLTAFTVAAATHAASLEDGSITRLGGQLFETDSAVLLADSAASELSVAGLKLAGLHPIEEARSGLDTLRLAILSDTQPRANDTVVGIDERAKVQEIYRQLRDNANLAGVRGVRHLGDLMHRGKPEPSDTSDPYTFDDAIADMSLTGIDHANWEVIPGNHDKNYGDEDDYQFAQGFDEFERYFGYSAGVGYRRQGTLCEFFMQTEYGATAGKYPDFQIDLLRKALRWSKGCLFVIHTHHPLSNTTYNTDPVDPDNVFVESDRIWDLLDEFEAGDLPKVCVMSGHNGTGNATLPGRESHVTITTSGKSHDVDCFQVGLHVPSWANQEGTGTDHNMSYVVMDATAGSTDVIFRRWDVETQTFLTGADNEVTISAPQPMRLPVDCELNTRRSIHPGMPALMREVMRVLIQPQKQYNSSSQIWEFLDDTGPVTALELGLIDQLNQDNRTGMGPVIDFLVATGLSTDTDAGLRSGKRAGRFGVVRSSGTENDQSGELYLALSDAAGALTRVISGDKDGLVIKTLPHAFHADREANVDAPSSTGDLDITAYETVDEPVGNTGHFNGATGVFTADRNGWYRFEFHADTSGSGSGNAEIFIVHLRNSVETEHHVDWFYPSEERVCGGSLEISLEVDDEIFVRIGSWDANAGSFTKARFMGHQVY